MRPRGSWGSREPRKGKESHKEPKKDGHQPKKTLHDACKEMKLKLAAEERERERVRREDERRGEDEALTTELYGPHWREAG